MKGDANYDKSDTVKREEGAGSTIHYYIIPIVERIEYAFELSMDKNKLIIDAPISDGYGALYMERFEIVNIIDKLAYINEYNTEQKLSSTKILDIVIYYFV